MQLTEERMNHISDVINNQDGQDYPCSNQIVTCGFISTENKWNKFVEKYKSTSEIKLLTKERLFLSDGTQWRFLDINKTNFHSIRGLRYYKIKIDKCIDVDTFEMCIMPYCSFYCKEIEWI